MARPLAAAGPEQKVSDPIPVLQGPDHNHSTRVLSNIDQLGCWCHFTGQEGHYVLADLKRITSYSLSLALRFTKCPLVHLGPRRDPETPETLRDIPDIKRLPSVQTAVI